jgi:hypothetical protein
MAGTPSGHLHEEIMESLGYEATQQFISQKHGLSNALLSKINLHALQTSLKAFRLFHPVNIVKLIHGWNPMYATLCRQGRESSPLCPRCCRMTDITTHFLQCPHPDAVKFQHNALLSMLQTTLKQGTPIQMILTFEYKLSLALSIPYTSQFRCASTITNEQRVRLLMASKFNRMGLLSQGVHISGMDGSMYTHKELLSQ